MEQKPNILRAAVHFAMIALIVSTPLVSVRAEYDPDSALEFWRQEYVRSQNLKADNDNEKEEEADKPSAKPRVHSAKPSHRVRTEANPSVLNDDESNDGAPETPPLPPKRPSELAAKSPADCADCKAGGPSKTVKLAKEVLEATDKKTIPLPPPRPHFKSDSTQPSAIMLKIARMARAGKGRAPTNYCYRGVKQILMAAGFKRAPGASAIDAMQDLPRMGFKNTFPKNCDSAGTVRVYRGHASKMSSAKARAVMAKRKLRLTAGDIHGHAEVVGGNGKYYHFTGASRPINKTPYGANRRVLVGCFVQ